MNNLFKKFCGAINYKTYNNIAAVLLSTGFSAGITDAIMNFNGIENFGLLDCISSFSYFSYLYFSYSNGEFHTKDINEVRKLYQEFIYNYNKMNRDFGFNEPISIYVMFNYLFSNGYLSKDKCFEFSNNECNNICFLYGADVLNGRGVCRHILSMLTDILNGYEISALNVSCYAPTSGLDAIPVSFEEYSREKNIEMICKYIISNKERQSLIQKIIFLEEEGIYLKLYLRCFDEVDSDKNKSNAVNHLITYALCDGKSYYLDPTQSRIYRLKENSKGNLYDEYSDTILIKKKAFWKLNNKEDKNIGRLRNNVFRDNDGVPLEEEKNIVLSTLDICKSNMDTFEKFYNENKELYGEIANKLVRIKKR